MRYSFAIWVATVAFLSFAPRAFADQEQYPSRPIKIVVPMPAGSTPDIRIRLVSEQLSKNLGQKVIVENHPGAGGAIGVQAALSAPADGYTLIAAQQSTFTILPVQNNKLSFDVNSDLVPIATVMAEAQILAVSPKLKIGSLTELIARAKTEPDTIMIGTNPAGSLPYLAAHLIISHSKASITVIPYSRGGSNEAIREIMGGRIQAVIDGRPALKGALDAGTLKALAIMTNERLQTVPDLPTVAETLPGVTAVGWFVLCAPKGTPTERVTIITAALHKALDAPELLKQVEQIGTPFRPN